MLQFDTVDAIDSGCSQESQRGPFDMLSGYVEWKGVRGLRVGLIGARLRDVGPAGLRVLGLQHLQDREAGLGAGIGWVQDPTAVAISEAPHSLTKPAGKDRAVEGALATALGLRLGRTSGAVGHFANHVGNQRIKLGARAPQLDLVVDASPDVAGVTDTEARCRITRENVSRRLAFHFLSSMPCHLSTSVSRKCRPTAPLGRWY